MNAKYLGGFAFFGSAIAASIAGYALRNQTDIRTANRDISSYVASTSKQDIPEADYFEQIVELLKIDYVDPVTDEGKLAAGAVKSMVSSLNDMNSHYMDPDEFKAFKKARMGTYEGIGVDLVLEDTGAEVSLETGQPVATDAASAGIQLPKLTVAAVVPGSPAEKAGVKVGDWVETIEGKWVMNGEPINELRRAQQLHDKGKLPMDRILELRKDLREKIKHMIVPLKARDKVILGNQSMVNVTWMRGAKKIETSIMKTGSTVPSLARKAGTIALRFAPGVADDFKAAIGTGPITLDLRSNVFGDYKEMKKCLDAVSPKGTYGEIYKMKGNDSFPLKVETGAAKKRPITLIVDGSTRGVASIFARALSSKGLAQLKGVPSTDTSVVEMVALPDGSAFTLTTGKYRTGKAKK